MYWLEMYSLFTIVLITISKYGFYNTENFPSIAAILVTSEMFKNFFFGT